MDFHLLIIKIITICQEAEECFLYEIKVYRFLAVRFQEDTKNNINFIISMYLRMFIKMEIRINH